MSQANTGAGGHRAEWAQAFAEAAPGPVLQGDLISLSKKGNLRVRCDWMYSALNCDPNNAGSFRWTVNKVGDGIFSLSPVNVCPEARGKTLYASTRPDNDMYLSVQAAGSARWVDQVRADEEYRLHQIGTIVRFSWASGGFVTVDADKTNHKDYAAYRLRGNGTVSSDSCQWFLGVSQVLQPNLKIRHRSEVTVEDLARDCAAAGIAVEDDRIHHLMQALKQI